MRKMRRERKIELIQPDLIWVVKQSASGVPSYCLFRTLRRNGRGRGGEGGTKMSAHLH